MSTVTPAAVPVDPRAVASAAEAVAQFGSGVLLTARIGQMEAEGVGCDRVALAAVLERHSVDQGLLGAALLLKAASSQIDVVVHTVGILMALPHVLEPDERVQSLSLGAGNSNRPFDLETDRRIAEFKFIAWKGGSESIRQNQTFVDVFSLAAADTPKRKVLYLVGAAHALKFLAGKRALRSVLSKNSDAARRFEQRHGDEYSTVGDWFLAEGQSVQIVDLNTAVPGVRWL